MAKNKKQAKSDRAVARQAVEMTLNFVANIHGEMSFDVPDEVMDGFVTAIIEKVDQ